MKKFTRVRTQKRSCCRLCWKIKGSQEFSISVLLFPFPPNQLAETFVLLIKQVFRISALQSYCGHGAENTSRVCRVSKVKEGVVADQYRARAVIGKHICSVPCGVWTDLFPNQNYPVPKIPTSIVVVASFPSSKFHLNYNTTKNFMILPEH